MIILTIPTELGPITVRKGEVCGRRHFTWRRPSDVAPIGPFSTLIDCLSDLTNVYEYELAMRHKALTALEQRRRA